jgi:uncharacterized membrane protein YeaQ/YmgE (transglycosylase-associated protein family)
MAVSFFAAPRMIKAEWLFAVPERGNKIMNLLLWIALGALAGWLAGLIMGGEKRGILGNVVLGVLGSMVGGFAASLLGLGGVDGLNVYSLLIAVAGACLVLWISGLARRAAKR